jgi:hypothetical protein
LPISMQFPGRQWRYSVDTQSGDYASSRPYG